MVSPLSKNYKTKQQAFTLLELLIVIAILAVLAVIVIVVINPAEAMRKTRDTQRMTELSSLSEAVSFLQTESQGTLDLDGPSVNTCKAQANQTIYLSLVDNASAVCNTLIAAGDLPAAPAGWQYSCITAANLYNVDGTGWIPIDFNSVAGVGSPISNLPADPVNNASQGLYYQYICDATNSVFEIDPILESQAYKRGGDKDAVSTDGGDNFNLYESGTDLTSSPISDSGLVGYWQLEENIGTSASDSSGNDNTGTLDGPNWISGKIGYALDFGGNGDAVETNSYTYTFGSEITLSAWFKYTSSGVGSPRVVEISANGDANSHCLAPDADGTLRAWVECDNGSRVASADDTNNYNNGNWHFMVYTYSNPNGILYVDGEITETPSGACSNLDDGAYFIIGAISDVSGQYTHAQHEFDGYIDEVRVYDRALSAAEIKLQYLAEK